jgi:endogenous inhibitor of DNA gyrase (YacG/DUF329 family)
MATAESGRNTECPTCGRDDFASRTGMKIHHSSAHGESIAGVEVECSNCGEIINRGKWEVKEAEHLFCDDGCRGEWMSNNRTGDDHPRWVSREQCVCDNCEKVFEQEKWHTEKRERVFCSRDCYGEWLSRNRSGADHHQYKDTAHKKKECQYCGEQFVADVHSGPNIYCSNECYHKSGRATAECTYCGEQFTKARHRVEQPDRPFCSRRCCYRWLEEYNHGENHWQWEENPSPIEYGGKWWESRRKKAIRRDQARCRDCQITESDHLDAHGFGLDVHHISPARYFDDPKKRDRLSNLITLCRRCHFGKWEPVAPLRPDTQTVDS